MPTPEDIDTRGLDIKLENLKKLLEVDKDMWLQEITSIKQYFQKFDRVPQEMEDELKALEQRLMAY